MFNESDFNDADKDLHSCILEYLDSVDWWFYITCECGMWEEMPADMPRHKTQSFDWLQNCNITNTAYYSCPDCGTVQRSEVIPDFGLTFIQ